MPTVALVLFAALAPKAEYAIFVRSIASQIQINAILPEEKIFGSFSSVRILTKDPGLQILFVFNPKIAICRVRYYLKFELPCLDLSQNFIFY